MAATPPPEGPPATPGPSIPEVDPREVAERYDELVAAGHKVDELTLRRLATDVRSGRCQNRRIIEGAAVRAELRRRTQRTPDTERPAPAGLFRATRLDSVTPEAVRWLWPRRLPLGKLVTLDGDPDVGKSTLCIDWAARITTGRPMPGEHEASLPAADVVLLAAEDALHDTIRPRLEAAGADLTRVHHLDEVPVLDDAGEPVAWVRPTLPDNLDALESLVTATGAVLVIVDVLMAYLSGRTDSYRDQDVRRALQPIADMAQRTGACVLLLRHIPKSRRRGGDGLAAGSGSMGIVGQARAGMIAAKDPEDPSGRRRVLARAKSNLGPDWASLAYQLLCSTCRRPACTTLDHGPAVIDWLGETAVNDEQLLAERESAEQRSETDEATDWLRSVLSDGPMPKAEIIQLARVEGITAKVLRTARERLGLIVDRDQNARGRPATWRLPDYVPALRAHDYVPSARARNHTPSNQEQQPSSADYVPSSESGHVIGNGQSPTHPQALRRE